MAAQQIYIVLQCKKNKKPQFIFTDGDVVDMDREFGIFLTMVRVCVCIPVNCCITRQNSVSFIHKNTPMEVSRTN